MWVDLLLAPSGTAVLGQQATWITDDLIGNDSLMKGSNADSLEGMCCFLGLVGMLPKEHVGPVAAALSERAERTAPSLCQWLAHLPVGQDYMYGGDWKRPQKSSELLKMSPLLSSQAYVTTLDALLRLLRLMADPQTEKLYPRTGARFVAACLDSRHLPAAMRRQVIGRHEDEAFAGVAGLAVDVLVHLCGAYPIFKKGLSEHPRAAALLQRVARLAPEDPASSLVQRDHADGVRQLRDYCRHAIEDGNQPPLKHMRGREVSECDWCGAWCERQQRCGACKAASYCDAVCQKAAWKSHKKACKASKAAR